MTVYKKYNVKLSKNQKFKLVKAVINKSPITLRLSKNDLSGNDNIFITQTQINKIKKAQNLKKGVDITISKTQISKMSFANKETSKKESKHGKGLHNRPQPSFNNIGQGLRNRPFNIYDYAQYQSPPIIGSFKNKNGLGLKKKE